MTGGKAGRASPCTHIHMYKYTLTSPLAASDLEKWVLRPMGIWECTPVPLRVAVCSTVPVPKRAQAVASQGHEGAPSHLREVSEVLGENSLALSWAILGLGSMESTPRAEAHQSHCGAVQCWQHPSGRYPMGCCCPVPQAALWQGPPWGQSLAGGWDGLAAPQWG